jgi:hypothetical protein
MADRQPARDLPLQIGPHGPHRVAVREAEQSLQDQDRRGDVDRDRRSATA